MVIPALLGLGSDGVSEMSKPMLNSNNLATGPAAGCEIISPDREITVEHLLETEPEVRDDHEAVPAPLPRVGRGNSPPAAAGGAAKSATKPPGAHAPGGGAEELPGAGSAGSKSSLLGEPNRAEEEGDMRGGGGEEEVWEDALEMFEAEEGTDLGGMKDSSEMGVK
ncbi:hypothetical protein TeGR_g10617, partial [Tetraparma gracilis]